MEPEEAVGGMSLSTAGSELIASMGCAYLLPSNAVSSIDFVIFLFWIASLLLFLNEEAILTSRQPYFHFKIVTVVSK